MMPAMTDEDHILDLLARYARYTDERDSSAWAELFAEHATTAPRSGARYQGRAAIQTSFDGLVITDVMRWSCHEFSIESGRDPPQGAAVGVRGEQHVCGCGGVCGTRTAGGADRRRTGEHG
jgi:hypothetical protein